MTIPVSNDPKTTRNDRFEQLSMSVRTTIVDKECQSVLDDSPHVGSLSWRGLKVTVKDRATKQMKVLVNNIDGIVKAGECCALMGPSGSGKTTLLNCLAKQPARSQMVDGNVYINGKAMPISTFRKISCFVRNDEPCIGALTVSETLHFACRLTGPRNMTAKARKHKVDCLIESFGLADQADSIIGTPFRKSLSDGQKRRVMVARQVATSPKILFLDEPTSGLDSAASFEVIQYLSRLAKSNNLIVLCSIHQPSVTTLNLFDKLLLFSTGKMLYFGAVGGLSPYFSTAHIEIPSRVNPAEYLLDLVNTDFIQDKTATTALVERLRLFWTRSVHSKEILDSISKAQESEVVRISNDEMPSLFSRIITLMHRDFIKALRDPMSYGIRFTFAMSFAILLGTVWFRLDYRQESIESVISEIFFAVCFISLSAIIYAPAYIEDYLNFVQDSRNGFYGPLEFAASNFFVGIPYLFSSSLMFSLVSFWLSSPLREATAFWNWVLWVFLTSFAAEALIVLVVTVYPNFMFAIASASFVNSVLLCAQGFFITEYQMNVFYKYVFHYWDYLGYSFRGIMVRQFGNATYHCGDNCQCLYNSTLASQCQIAGEAVLKRYGLGVEENLGRNVGIMIAISLGYRLASFVLLRVKN